MKILVVEDDAKIASFLQKGLSEESYSVDLSAHADEAVYLAQVNAYDIILLDVMLPGRDGMDVCRTLRERKVTTPIIMLSARNRLSDKIDGLDSGADDYLTKPFAFEELLARIRVQLRDPSKVSNIISVGDLSIDTSRHEVIRADKKISLTPKEYALLEYLARNKEKLLSETLINENLSNMNQEVMSNVVNVYIYRLRNKIDKGFEKKLIHTIKGAGYMLSEDDV
ncbi:MAG: response regulator transcription factor [Campylobacterales bacterium]|nr:response regulator transcription factor [Campylobacterales bacterium]